MKNWIKKRIILEAFFRLCMKIFRVQSVVLEYSELDKIDHEAEITALLRRLQFQESIKKGWMRGFVRVVIKDDCVLIGHDLPGNHLRMTNVDNPLQTLLDFINYFDRI